MTHTSLPAEAHESSSDAVIEYPEDAVMQGVPHADGTLHYPDGSIQHPDGTIEINGYLFDPIDWDELDPPEGSPGAEEIPHEVAMAEVCKSLGWPPGTL